MLGEPFLSRIKQMNINIGEAAGNGISPTYSH